MANQIKVGVFRDLAQLVFMRPTMECVPHIYEDLSCGFDLGSTAWGLSVPSSRTAGLGNK